MEPALFLLWFAIGICPDWWPFPPFPWPVRVIPPRPPFPGPNPGPRPWWTAILSGLGGVAGGWLFSNTWGPAQGNVDAFYAGITCLGALAGSILVGGVAETFLRSRGPAAK